MIAVNPTRLRFQIEELLVFFDQPQTFRRHLEDLFDLYANRALHYGETQQKKPVAPMFHLPPPLIRQLQVDLKPRIQQAPQSALELADELWGDLHFEIKQLAIFVLGNAPVDQPEPVLDRLDDWLDPNLDEELITNLLSTGTANLRNNFPTLWENFIQSLLNNSDPKKVGIGIQGIKTGIEESDIKNYPSIFRLISPTLVNPHDAHLQALEKLIKALIKSSPTETAYFLKQTLSLSQSPETSWLIKRCLPSFPENIRRDLTSSLNQ